jgi:hypothetical protein
VNFIIVGLAPSDDKFHVEVADNNTHHDFSMSYVHGDTYRHRRIMAPEAPMRAETRISTSMTLLNLSDGLEDGTSVTSFKLEKTEIETLPNGTTITTHGGFSPEKDLLDAIEESYADRLGIIKESNPGMTDDEALHVLLDQQYEYNIVLRLVGVGLEFDILPWDYKGNPIDLDR